MALYEIVAPCVTINEDGSATVHRRPGLTVALTDEQAASVPDCLRKVRTEPVEGEDAPPAEPEPTGQPVTFIEEVPEATPEPAPTKRSRNKDPEPDGQ